MPRINDKEYNLRIKYADRDQENARSDGPEVGSYQVDDLRRHIHELFSLGQRGLQRRQVAGGLSGNGGANALSADGEEQETAPGEFVASDLIKPAGTHLKTRPKNAYVLFIIKAK